MASVKGTENLTGVLEATMRDPCRSGPSAKLVCGLIRPKKRPTSAGDPTPFSRLRGVPRRDMKLVSGEGESPGGDSRRSVDVGPVFLAVEVVEHGQCGGQYVAGLIATSFARFVHGCGGDGEELLADVVRWVSG